MRSEHTIWFAVYDDIQTLDLAGPMEMFSTATRLIESTGRAGAGYRLRVVHPSATSIRTEAGIRIIPDQISDDETTPDTVVFVGGDGVHDAVHDPAYRSWATDLAGRTPRVASVCTGTFLLAATGRASGRQVTTHWARSRKLATAFPDIIVEDDRLHIHDGPVWSSAGVVAGIDLALAMIEHDHDAALAQDVARWMVVFLRRTGGQSQFAAPVWSEAAETEPISEAKQLMHRDPSASWSVDRLATEVGMSERNFSRRFRAEVGESPARYLEHIRISVARNQLERTPAGVEAIARHAGFGTAETMRRAFVRRLGVSPDHYRNRFRLQETSS